MQQILNVIFAVERQLLRALPSMSQWMHCSGQSTHDNVENLINILGPGPRSFPNFRFAYSWGNATFWKQPPKPVVPQSHLGKRGLDAFLVFVPRFVLWRVLVRGQIHELFEQVPQDSEAVYRGILADPENPFFPLRMMSKRRRLSGRSRRAKQCIKGRVGTSASQRVTDDDAKNFGQAHRAEYAEQEGRPHEASKV